MILSEIWIPAAIAGGALQAWRTAVQRRVGDTLSVNAASLTRFLYGLPFALLLLAGYQWITIAPLPTLTGAFLFYCAAGGVAQILATNLLLLSFRSRGFLAGTAYSKTEAVQAALLGALLLNERLSPLAWGGIVLGVGGVILLGLPAAAAAGPQPRRPLFATGAFHGILSGSLFAFTALAIRRATLGLGGADPVQAALLALAATLAMQCALQGAWLALREREQIVLVARTWRTSGQVGLLSTLGSACWFTGFATAPVALVRVVGQVEVGFTMAFASFYLHEPVRGREVSGLLLVAAGVVLALLGT